MPTWQGNDRFYNDAISEIKHPSLTLNGFDPGTSGHGLGLKQILEEAYSGSPNESIADVYFDLRVLASDDAKFHESPSNQQEEGRAQIIENTRRMQARAFMALVTYVMERNGEGDELEPLPDNIETPDKAADRLRSALTNTDAWRIVKDWKDDGVKWSTVLENMARTMDLYLALENAYCYYGNQGHTPSQQECSGATTDRLLSKTEKGNVFAHFGEQIKSLESSKNWGYSALPTDRYSAEVGNASLKIQTAVGYASLTHQTVNPVTGVPPSAVQDYVNRALKANFQSAGTDRTRYWGYQTDDGEQFWAEGPYYFRFALKDVLPFWHATRINGMLAYHPDFNAPDPFYHPRFTEPLHWLADLTTPKGKTPPLDDGNKYPMRVSMLLRWTNSYGVSSLGKKFDWIADTYSYGAANDLLPVEIAIPRVKDSSIPPDPTVGNTSAGQTGENGEQQIVLRRGTSSNACEDANTGSPGDCHYLLLNGESGDSYRRGEGHEQPDQLQLLYYVDSASILMDRGYDNASFNVWEGITGQHNSSWNSYLYHNILHGFKEGGAYQAPMYQHRCIKN